MTQPPNTETCPMVWYASYGSNLQRARFMCYIEGGIALGSSKTNPGSRDKTPPAASKQITLNCTLYFAGWSKGWNGAPAFVREGRGNSITYGRMYLITCQQFNDVVLQENGLPADGTLVVPSYEQLAGEGQFALRGDFQYGRLLHPSNDEGYPILTFTTARELPISPPSEAYVKVIAAGLRETYPLMTDSEICDYFAQAPGISNGSLDVRTITSWVTGHPA